MLKLVLKVNCTFAFVNKDVLQFIQEKGLFSPSQKIILAVSGGKDSMALWHFLLQNHFQVVAAHCNFSLRGAESDLDAALVARFAKESDTQFYSKRFDTKSYAEKKGISIQEAARDLRYAYLEKVRQKEQAVGIVTAHHLDDNIETLIQKLVKGTGLKGMRAMRPKQQLVLRPLLETHVDEITAYVALHKIPYREDASNASTKYDRNKIRHEITPLLKTLNAGYHKIFRTHFKRWQNIENLYEAALDLWRKKLLKKQGNDIQISKLALVKIEGFEALLFELLSPYGFTSTAVDNLTEALHESERKIFYSETHRLLSDKRFLYLTALSDLAKSEVHYITEKQDKISFENGTLRFHYKPISKHSKLTKSEQTAYIDTAALSFPLELRKWKAGDYFYPLGITKKNGKPGKKKLAKYFKDQKISTRDKEQAWVLCADNKIIWVLGHRLDYRFAISDKTKALCVIKYSPD